MDVPKGFRATSTSQAIFDYAEPIMKHINPNDPEGMNLRVSDLQHRSGITL